MVQTPRLRVRVLTSGAEDGVPVVFVDGNISSARFWEETMLALPPEYRAIAVDLRGYGETEALPVDATRGVRDWSDDLKALVDTLGLGRFHLVGWSMGGGIAMQYAIDHPSDLLSITLTAPMSPFGFGATRDTQGTPTTEDFAGSGGGTANPEFVKRLKEGDRSEESPLSPRNVMNAHYFKPPFRVSSEREEVFLDDILSARVGDGFYPGDMTESANWPGVAPGKSGFNNAMSPRYCNLSGFADISPRPAVLWVRGTDDPIVSDTSFYDFAFLGQIGAVPGWPGAELCPPQPMVSQMRAVLDAYKSKGGSYREEVIQDTAHSPHIEKAEKFNRLLHSHLREAAGSREATE
jgi:pimeloyl-ACP methyl ester carboxylesterase